MTNIEIKNLKTLPENLHFALIGIMLGDGFIYRPSITSNSRFEMSFGSNFKQFAESIGELFKEFLNTPVKTIQIKGKDRNYINLRLKTISLPVFNYYFNLFYEFDSEKGKFVKIVPKNISDLLNSVVLAYLIMTDGNFDKGRNRVRIYTNSYNKEDVERLAAAINTNLGIYAAVIHDRKNQWIITIGAKQLTLLREKVSTYFDPSMLYRIGV